MLVRTCYKDYNTPHTNLTSMAKIFLSHQWTLEDKVAMTQLLTILSQEITRAGHECFCSALCQQEMTDLHLLTYEERLQYCLHKQQAADIIIAIIVSKNESNGMKQEHLQAQVSQQQYVLFTKYPEIMPELQQNALTVTTFTTDNYLSQKIHDFLSSYH